MSMPLRSFVLAGWLEHVAANASERLTGMTGGRYELKHAVSQGAALPANRGHRPPNDTVRTPRPYLAVKRSWRHSPCTGSCRRVQAQSRSGHGHAVHR